MSKPYKDDIPPQFQQPKRSSGMGCVLGCLATLGIMALLCGGVIWWGYHYIPGMLAGKVRDAMVQAVNESELAPADKQEVVTQINRVVDKYRAGEIDGEQLMRVMEELGQSPVMAVVMLYAAEEKYIKPSGLSDEEKQAALLTLQRVLRGVVEKKIDPDELQASLNMIMEPNQGDQKKLKEKLTDDELKAFLAAMTQHADDAKIPLEPYNVRIGEEVKKAVDRALLPAQPNHAEAP